MRRRAAVVAGSGVLAVVMTVAGCTSGSDGDRTPTAAPTLTATATGTSTPTTASSGGSAASSPTAAAPGVATASTTAGGGPGPCTPTVARLSAGPSNGGDGHFGVVIVVTNASSSACATTGYPGVAQLDAAGEQLQQAERTPSGYLGGLPNGSSAPRIVLQPGQQASALLEGLDGNPTGPRCASSPAILLTLPDNTDSTTVTTTSQVCQDLQIHPLVVGPTGGVAA